jgi:hypothetical protein
MGGPLEVVGVGGLLPPEGLAVAFTGGATGRELAEALASSITRIGIEQPVAMEAFGGRRRTGHSPEEDVPVPSSHPPDPSWQHLPEEEPKKEETLSLGSEEDAPRTCPLHDFQTVNFSRVPEWH